MAGAKPSGPEVGFLWLVSAPSDKGGMEKRPRSLYRRPFSKPSWETRL